MLAFAERSDAVMSIQGYSQIANVNASPEIRKIGNYSVPSVSQNADMYEYDESDKNGGPNFLRAWMDFRKVKGVELAEKLGGNVTPGMVSDLANSNRALSAKWLRRIAPILKTTPGLLLDHDPRDLDDDVIERWVNANAEQKRQISEIAKTLTRTGTDD